MTLEMMYGGASVTQQILVVIASSLGLQCASTRSLDILSRTHYLGLAFWTAAVASLSKIQYRETACIYMLWDAVGREKWMVAVCELEAIVLHDYLLPH